MQKSIIGFSNYEISDEGLVRNKITKYILKGRVTKTGYLQVSLKSDETGNFKNQYIHRLVALHFLEQNDDNKKEVNHKDRNKQNNKVDNLEQVTHQENQKHIYQTGIKMKGRKIGMFDINGILIRTFDSIVEAYQSLNKVSRVNIDNVLQGKQHTAYGYVQKYLD